MLVVCEGNTVKCSVGKVMTDELQLNCIALYNTRQQQIPREISAVFQFLTYGPKTVPQETK